MNQASCTGLIPQPCKKVQHKLEKKNFILPFNICKKIELSTRPFGDLFNPYSTRCSVLCNHPAPTVLRDHIKNARQSKSPDGKNYTKLQTDFENFQIDENNTIPDEFFRRYHDTDSRPHTPSASSIRTKASITGSMLNARRCITPEWGKAEIIKRKKIILDLRRTHSQETVFSKGASDLSYGIDLQPEKINNKKVNESKAKSTSSLLVCHEIKTSFDNQTSQSPIPPVSASTPPQGINERDDTEEQDEFRRGKRRKKIKQPTAIFHLNKDPETQVSTVGPESVNVSTRPSLIPIPDDYSIPYNAIPQSEVAEALKDSFLTPELFYILSSSLDQDILENTFEPYLNLALQEAMKYVYLRKPKSNAENLNDNLEELTFDNHFNIPRKLSRSAYRFEIPIDLSELERITAVNYLSKYVWISRHQKKLYKKIFINHIEVIEPNTTEQQIQTERFILHENFEKALFEVVGYYGSKEIIERIIELLEVEKNDTKLNFRTWCGIAAFTERLAFLHQDEVMADPDSCDELEKTDFDSFETRKSTLKLNQNLNNVLDIIRKAQL